MVNKKAIIKIGISTLVASLSIAAIVKLAVLTIKPEYMYDYFFYQGNLTENKCEKNKKLALDFLHSELKPCLIALQCAGVITVIMAVANLLHDFSVGISLAFTAFSLIIIWNNLAYYYSYNSNWYGIGLSVQCSNMVEQGLRILMDPKNQELEENDLCSDHCKHSDISVDEIQAIKEKIFFSSKLENYAQIATGFYSACVAMTVFAASL